MSWFIENDERTFTQRLIGKFLTFGPIPNHIAIIMDGNRRYAKKTKVEHIKGHDKGFSKLIEAMFWCKQLNIKEITVYAFSIENFKRPKEEVDELLKLAAEKFEGLLDDKEKLKLKKWDLCIKIIGDLSLLPLGLQKTMAKIMEVTKEHKTLLLNICFAYTSREEMTDACKEICNGISEGIININDINEALIDKCMYTKSAKVDLLIRTSGEVRLSDFLLWQCDNTTLSFENNLWPDFSVWDFYSAILRYKLNTQVKSNDREIQNETDALIDTKRKQNQFIQNLNLKRDEAIKNILLKK